jgi:hypothetical protein
MNFFQLNSSHCSATQIQNFFSFPLPKKNWKTQNWSLL